LAVGDKPDGFPAAMPVLIAWDGSDPAGAAVRAAVPLLALSDSVTILEVDDGSIEVPAETAAAYLSRNGIHAEIIREDVPNRDYVEAVLLAKLGTGRFGWAVMGAYSHSRIRERLFGGVTQRLLQESPLPLFIAH
jgi:nucleotide-binding universal stress UspA family protein